MYCAYSARASGSGWDIAKLTSIRVPETGQSLDELCRRAQDCGDLTAKDLALVKRLYRSCRAAFKTILLESADDEYRTLAIAFTLRSFERGEIADGDYLDEIMYAYRVLRDFSERGRTLRTEAAYRMALAALFHSSQISCPSPRRVTPATIELLHQLRELVSALKTYARWSKRHLTAANNDAVPQAA